jgi:hypothetical protein
MESKITSPTIKGVILSLILIVFSLATTYAGMAGNKTLGIVPALLCIGGIIWACINYSKQMDHNVTFGNVFSHGFKMVATITAIMAIYTLLLFLVLRPDLVDTMLEQSRADMVKRGSSDSDIETGMRIGKKMFIPFALIGVVLVYGIGGTIIALIGAAVAKKNPNPTPFQ